MLWQNYHFLTPQDEAMDDCLALKKADTPRFTLVHFRMNPKGE
jgi:hypothetical protein